MRNPNRKSLLNSSINIDKINEDPKQETPLNSSIDIYKIKKHVLFFCYKIGPLRLMTLLVVLVVLNV